MTVLDSGRGMTASQCSAVFEPYERAAEAAGGGNGLGLSIAKFAAEAMGGRVRCSSGGPGLGSAFTVEVPVEEAGPACDADEQMEGGGVHPSPADAPAEVPGTPAQLPSADSSGYSAHRRASRRRKHADAEDDERPRQPGGASSSCSSGGEEEEPSPAAVVAAAPRATKAIRRGSGSSSSGSRSSLSADLAAGGGAPSTLWGDLAFGGSAAAAAVCAGKGLAGGGGAEGGGAAGLTSSVRVSAGWSADPLDIVSADSGGPQAQPPFARALAATAAAASSSSASATSTTEGSSAAAAAAPPPPPLRCVLVDDDRVCLALASVCLRRKGLIVQSASSGAEALALAQRALSPGGGGLDCVITDLNMPGGIGGLELCEALRAAERALAAEAAATRSGAAGGGSGAPPFTPPPPLVIVGLTGEELSEGLAAEGKRVRPPPRTPMRLGRRSTAQYACWWGNSSKRNAPCGVGDHAAASTHL